MHDSSSIIFRTDWSQNQYTEGSARRELTISPEMENIIQKLQESIKCQQNLESVVKDCEKQKAGMENEMNELKIRLHKLEGQKNVLPYSTLSIPLCLSPVNFGESWSLKFF